MTKPLLLLIAFAWGAQALAGGREESTLSELKPGRRFEIIQDVSVEVPALLRLLESIPPFELTESSVRLAPSRGTAAPVCLVSGLALNPDFPNQLKLPKGATVEVSSVEPGNPLNPLYVGKSVAFAVSEAGTRLKAHLRCFPGKGGGKMMSFEAFERVFRHKIRVLSGP